MNDLVHNLLAPWHLALDTTILIGFISWKFIIRMIEKATELSDFDKAELRI